MKADLYTKFVLTVIALALSVIAIQQTLTPAYAQSNIQKVVICDPQDNSTCAKVNGRGWLQVIN
jgi:hypothetical protein